MKMSVTGVCIVEMIMSLRRPYYGGFLHRSVCIIKESIIGVLSNTKVSVTDRTPHYYRGVNTGGSIV